MAEAALGDVHGEVTMHRVRLQESLQQHPLAGHDTPLDQQPIASRMLRIMQEESNHIKLNGPQRIHLLLCPWPYITKRIAADCISKHAAQGWQQPSRRWEIAPYASTVARIGEHERWLHNLCKRDFEPLIDSFAIRPPTNSVRHVAALHFPGRLNGLEAGGIPKLTPLSCRGPHGFGSIVALCRLASSDAFMISKARQGNTTMHMYPFANLWKTGKKEPGKKRKASGASKAIAFDGKTCHLCCEGDNGPGYDLWHVLFDCPATINHPAMVGLRRSCQSYVGKLCKLIRSAAEANSSSMSNTENSGVNHRFIQSAALDVEQLANRYDWDCLPGRWTMYCIVLAMPFPAKVVVPPPGSASPVLPEEQYSLPRALGHLFDVTKLSSDSLRPLADDWCRHAVKGLRTAGSVVCPLRTAAEARISSARAAARPANL